MTNHKLLLISLLFILIINPDSYSQNTSRTHSSFKEPVNFPLLLSGTFGELRSNHFHSGIDIKTGGITGKKIVAIDDGYISRIKISSGGYGRALYINHPEKGYSSVYAHLESFKKSVDQYVISKQYENESFSIQLYPEPGKFEVKKGQVIGYSGNSGGSLAPHLHFEVRKMNNQHPINPMRFNFNIKDNIPPKIFQAAIYPVNKQSRINGKNKKMIFPVKKSRIKNTYSPKNKEIIEINGKIGFGIKTFDFLNESLNWCGVNSVKLYIDGELWYHHQLDEFSFSETRYINSLIDYEEKILNNSTIQKLFVEPNNQLSIYKFTRNRGIVQFHDNLIHEVKFIIQDTYKNESTLKFSVKNINRDTTKFHENKLKYIELPYNQKNKFTRDQIKIDFPPYAFYDTVYFEYEEKLPKDEKVFSNIHFVHKKTTPVHKYFNISIKASNLPPSLSEKAFIAYKNGEDKDYEYVGGEKVNGFFTAQARKFGKYCIMADTTAPIVKPKHPDKINKDGVIAFHVEDNLAGIETYNGYIDNQWALFEYDPKNNLLFYKIDKQRLNNKKEHELELYVGDAKNNITTYYSKFKL